MFQMLPLFTASFCTLELRGLLVKVEATLDFGFCSPCLYLSKATAEAA